MIKVAVTDLEYHKAAEVFRQVEGFECLCAPTPEVELADFIKNNDVSHVIVGVTNYQCELYDALPQGGVIARFGIGHDGIDKKLAARKGLLCTNTPGVLDNSVAECALGLILLAARKLAICAADNKNAVWKNRVGTEIAGKTLAVIGCGNIGRQVAKIAKAGFNMKVMGYDLKFDACDYIDEFSYDFALAVKNADFITIHIPGIPATKDFINAQRISFMQKTAVLINTARGGVLDEDALYDAVESETIGGAVLDVFKTEPYVPVSPAKDLRKLENIIMTPHIGSSTVEACNLMAERALRNIRQCVDSHRDAMDIIL